MLALGKVEFLTIFQWKFKRKRGKAISYAALNCLGSFACGYRIVHRCGTLGQLKGKHLL